MNKQNITIDVFKKMLYTSELSFSFTKKDGSIREARGTTNEEFLERENLYKFSENSNSTKQSEHIVKYFDLDSNGWRSFIFENLIEITKTVEL